MNDGTITVETVDPIDSNAGDSEIADKRQRCATDANLITELITVRNDYNSTFFELQECTKRLEHEKHEHQKTFDLLQQEKRQYADQLEQEKFEHQETIDAFEAEKQKHAETSNQLEQEKFEHQETLDEFEEEKRKHAETCNQLEQEKFEHQETLDEFEAEKRNHKMSSEQLEQEKHAHQKTKKQLESQKRANVQLKANSDASERNASALSVENCREIKSLRGAKRKLEAQAVDLRRSHPVKDPEDNEDSDHDTFEVEKLVKDKEKKGKRYFLVKWKGYNNRHNTWEELR